MDIKDTLKLKHNLKQALEYIYMDIKTLKKWYHPEGRIPSKLRWPEQQAKNAMPASGGGGYIKFIVKY